MNATLEFALRKLLSNVGAVDEEQTIFRSGQPKSHIKFLAVYNLLKFHTVINLAWSPKTDDDDNRERDFCLKNSIAYHGFTWGAGIPDDPKWDWVWAELESIVKLIDLARKPVWIHCEGGKDRTGGLVAVWKLRHGYPLDNICADFCKHGMPNVSWINYLWRIR